MEWNWLEVKKEEGFNGSIILHSEGGGKEVMRKCGLGNVRVHSSYLYVELPRVTIKLLPSENLRNLLCGNQLNDKRQTLVIKL